MLDLFPALCEFKGCHINDALHKLSGSVHLSSSPHDWLLYHYSICRFLTTSHWWAWEPYCGDCSTRYAEVLHRVQCKHPGCNYHGVMRVVMWCTLEVDWSLHVDERKWHKLCDAKCPRLNTSEGHQMSCPRSRCVAMAKLQQQLAELADS